MNATTSPTADPTTTPPATTVAGAHIWFLLDRSGSMAPLATAVVDGFNGFVVEQRNMIGTTDAPPARLSLAQFDGEAPFEELVYSRRIDKVEPLAPDAFQPRGSTPLYDAIARVVDRADQRVANRIKKARPAESQLVVIFTDGQENASRHWNQASIARRIEKRKAKGWTFVFLGANQDSYATGRGLAMAAGSVSDYLASPASMARAWGSVSRSVSMYLTKDDVQRRRDQDDFFDGTKEAEGDPAS